MAEPSRIPSSVELRNWCRGEGLDIKHVFMLTGVPEDTDVAYIEETMQSIKALGRVRVRGKMFDPQQNSLVVFCECREVVDITRVPSEVIPSDGRATWKLIISDEPSSSTEDFTEKLSRLLREEGGLGIPDYPGLTADDLPGNAIDWRVSGPIAVRCCDVIWGLLGGWTSDCLPVLTGAVRYGGESEGRREARKQDGGDVADTANTARTANMSEAGIWQR
ncbi:hypothetical protein SRHO_G00346460 [Serrasalmus rhombeus]